MKNLELLKQGYMYFGEGDIAGAISIWDPDIEWSACTGVPYITGDGFYY